MKNLENVVGLQEMNLQEMREVNGGIIGTLITGALLYIAWDIVMNPSASASAFKEGMDARMQM